MSPQKQCAATDLVSDSIGGGETAGTTMTAVAQVSRRLRPTAGGSPRGVPPRRDLDRVGDAPALPCGRAQGEHAHPPNNGAGHPAIVVWVYD